MLERLSLQVYIQAVEDGLCMKGECLVVGEGELHTLDHGVESVGLGAAVPVVHEVGVVNYLGDFTQYGVTQVVLFENRLEGTGAPAVGESGPGHVEELSSFRRFRDVPEEAKFGVRVYAATDQPNAGRPVYVTSSPCCPEHYPASSRMASPAPSFTTRRASRIAASATFRKGDLK